MGGRSNSKPAHVADCAPKPAISTRRGKPEYAPGLENGTAAAGLRAAFYGRRSDSSWPRPGEAITDEDLGRWSTLVYEACTVCNKCAMVCPDGYPDRPLIHDVPFGLDGLRPASFRPIYGRRRASRRTSEAPGVTETAWRERLDWIADEWEDDPIDKPGADTLVVFTSIELMKFPENLPRSPPDPEQGRENWTVVRPGPGSRQFRLFRVRRTADQAVFGACFRRGPGAQCQTDFDHRMRPCLRAFRWTAADYYWMFRRGIEIVHIVRAVYDFWKAGRIN